MLLHLSAHARAKNEGHIDSIVMHCHKYIMQNLQKKQAVVLYQCGLQQQGELEQGRWHAGDASAQGSQNCQGAPPHQCLKDQRLWHFIYSTPRGCWTPIHSRLYCLTTLDCLGASVPKYNRLPTGSSRASHVVQLDSQHQTHACWPV